jgi:hypothetical protein
MIRHFRKEAVIGGSPVSKVTRCMDKGIILELWQEKGVFLFSEMSRRSVGSIRPPFPRGKKRPGREADDLSASITSIAHTHLWLAQGQRELCTHWWTEMLEQLRKTPNMCRWWDRILGTEIQNERENAFLSQYVLCINLIYIFMFYF